jgi:twinkle protein
MNEINGFKIDKFNQYDLNEKSKYSTCPLCSSSRKKSTEKCATLHWDDGLGVCHHCGETFQLHTYKSKFENNNMKSYVRPEFVNGTELSDALVKWFEGRGISQHTLRNLKISEGVTSMRLKSGDFEKRNTIQFNYFKNGELIDIKYRDGEKNFKLYKDAERILYNIDSCRFSEDIVIVEGEIDVLSFYEAGKVNTVSTPNGSTLKGLVNLTYLDNCIEFFENKKRIYLALDNDEAGQHVQKEMIRRFGAERCYIVNFKECKDANEYLLAYGKQSLAECIKDADLVPLEGVSSVLDWEAQFDDYLVNGFKSGYKIGIPSFDNIFSTYTGQYIVVTGIPSSGKSEFVDTMVLGYNKNYGWKTAFASPENKPNQIHAGKIASKLCGQWINRQEQLNAAWFGKCKEMMHDSIKYIDVERFDLESVLAKTKELIFRFGIKCLVLDPYNKIKLLSSASKNINDYTNDYLLMIEEFARKHDILIILVAHPRKPELRDTKTYEPTMYDIKGGGEFYDMSPHGLCVHRDYENAVTKIKVLKVKFSHLGENNKHCFVKWNRNSGRYSDFSHQTEDAADLMGLQEDNSNYFIEIDRKDTQVSIGKSFYDVEKDDPFGHSSTSEPIDKMPF